MISNNLLTVVDIAFDLSIVVYPTHFRFGLAAGRVSIHHAQDASLCDGPAIHKAAEKIYSAKRAKVRVMTNLQLDKETAFALFV